MHTFVEGIKIELTPQQIALIKKEKNKRARYSGSFKSILKHYGFVRFDTERDSYHHPVHGWYAEIVDQKNFSEVWMTGRCLKKMDAPPGGWVYGSPEDIAEEINKALQNPELYKPNN